MQKPKIKFAGYLVILLFPFILIFILELILSGLYTVTNNRIFENLQESEKNSGFNSHPYERINFLSDLRGSKRKIAIFGGSSAAGYASSLNFGILLENSSTIVHNYATPGDPFVGFQAELLKIVMPYYDVIIIYAGHNEIWSYLYTKSYVSKTKIHLPDGNIIDAEPIFQNYKIKLNRVASLVNSIYATTGRSRGSLSEEMKVKQLLSKLRTVNIIRRVALKIINSFDVVLNDQSTSVITKKLPLYMEAPFISLADKEAFAINFYKELELIVSMRHSNQQIIISTVMSNDLYPPNLDSIVEGSSITLSESIAESLYSALRRGELLSNEKIVNLSEGAHKNFFKAIICNGSFSLKYPTKLEHACIRQFQYARDSDTLPYRVISDINMIIKSFAIFTKGTTVVDPEDLLRHLTNSKDYLSYFVDFQHPSEVGHALIASQISKVLNPEKGGENINYIACGAYEITIKDQTEKFLTDQKQLKIAINTNISWLKNAIDLTAVSWLHEYYLEQAIGKMSRCLNK